MKMFQCLIFSSLMYTTQKDGKSHQQVVPRTTPSTRTSTRLTRVWGAMFFRVICFSIQNIRMPPPRTWIDIFLFFSESFRASVIRWKITNVSFCIKPDGFLGTLDKRYKALNKASQCRRYDARLYTVNLSIILEQVEEQFICSSASATTWVYSATAHHHNNNFTVVESMSHSTVWLHQYKTQKMILNRKIIRTKFNIVHITLGIRDGNHGVEIWK